MKNFLKLHLKKPLPRNQFFYLNNFHYKWNRCPTVRESARLQSFPDDFVFDCRSGHQFLYKGKRPEDNRCSLYLLSAEVRIAVFCMKKTIDIIGLQIFNNQLFMNDMFIGLRFGLLIKQGNAVKLSERKYCFHCS